MRRWRARPIVNAPSVMPPIVAARVIAVPIAHRGHPDRGDTRICQSTSHDSAAMPNRSRA